MSAARSIEIAPGVLIPLAEIELRASRSGGPGGQHANVTASRIEASFDVLASDALEPEQKQLIASRLGPVVRAVAQESRGQARNRELALERLRSRLEAALKPRRKRRPTRPTRSSRESRIRAKRHRAERKALRRKPGANGW